jgi:hypothetical protein
MLMRGSFSLSHGIALSIVVTLSAGALAAQTQQSQLSSPAGQAASYRLRLAQQAAAAAQTHAAPKPYKLIAVTLPAPANDASFEAFRKQLADIANRKDRAALAKIVVPHGFFWEGESGDKADGKKAGIDNLAAAIGLDGQEGFGWDAIAAASQEPTLEPVADRKGVMCGPASPKFDEKTLDETTSATQTDLSEWGFPLKAGVEVRDSAQPSAAVIDKLGLNLIRVMPEEVKAGQPPPMMRIVTPAGKIGYVPVIAIVPLNSDQMCYVKDASGWKITGYFGGQ